MKKVISLLLSFVMIISITAGLNFSALASTNGHTQAEAVAWANNQVGKALDYDGAYGAQCVDLTVYYYVYLGQAAPLGNANQYVNGGKFCPSGWSYQSSPKAGDIMVSTSGPYGHVAIVTEIRSSSYVIVEQNYAGKQYCTPREIYFSNNPATTYIRPDFVNPVPQGSEMSSGYNRVLDDGLYIIANAASSSLVSSIYYLDIEGSARPAAANTNVSLWGPATKDNFPYYDMWYIKFSDGFYELTQAGTDMALDVYEASKSSGANVQVYSRNNSKAQRWAISNFGGGYRIQAKCSGFSLDVNGGGTVGGTNIQQCQNNNTNAQKWIFIKHTHQYGSWKVKTAATCTSGGVQTRSCSCGYTQESKTFATGHNWDNGTVTTQPTCTSHGIRKYRCKNNSSHTKTAVIFATGHKPVTDPAVAATCTKPGKTAGKHCSVCKMVIIAQATVKATGHTSDGGKVTTKATLSKAGTKTEKCTVCGKVLKRTDIAYPKSISLAVKSYTYNGNVNKPTVSVKDSNGKTISSSKYSVTYSSGCKNVGKYSVKITFKGNYTGTKTFTFTINPKGTTVSKLTTPKTKQITVTWGKQATQTTGYQIQYSTSKTFASGNKTATVTSSKTTSKTITGLTKGKTYYVRIRTYKTVGKTKYYSAWSTAKSVKTK